MAGAVCGAVTGGAGVVTPSLGFSDIAIGVVPAVRNGVGLGESIEVFRPREGGDRSAAGGEAFGTNPCAVTVNAAVGAHPRIVVSFGIKSAGEGERILVCRNYFAHVNIVGGSGIAC